MSLSPELRDRITRLVHSDRVVLFMKGTRESPECGFSAAVVGILDALLPEYTTVDVLSDREIREGIKELSEWPTIPQLYAGGEFLGGCDIVREMQESGELRRALGLPPLEECAPSLTITGEAAEILSHAMKGREDQTLHLRIDAQFRASLAFAAAQEGEIRVESSGIPVLLDRESAARAEEVTIHVIRTDQGPELAIANPGAPTSVEPIGPRELARLLEEGRAPELIDVRTAEERAQSTIPGSHLLDEETRRRLEKLDRDTPLVFHCQRGGRGLAAAEHFARLGFTNVHNLTGGIEAWTKQVSRSDPGR